MNTNISNLNPKNYHEIFNFLTNTDNRLRIKSTTKIRQLIRATIFIPFIANRARIRRYIDCVMMVKTFSLNSISTDLTTPSVQLAADCFRMGRKINQFRRLCRPQSPISISPSESSTGTYSSISVTETAKAAEPVPSFHAELKAHEDCDIDVDEDAYVCEINAHDHYRLCKTRAAHDWLISDHDILFSNKGTISCGCSSFEDSRFD